ncbi:hypothetical protein Glove_296g22 [Diversispora epigaea]|uniref:Uncharacterized protein n=1 Tax=Diversispora epigaea TaxID=1348612 RepID=A0A397HY99_9GLOM|nr:hypothetical protein Glove_296g22 [Diversispora epigaea]
MSQTYSEAVKKPHDEVDTTENTEADLIVNSNSQSFANNDNNQVRINGSDYNNNLFEEDKSSENFEATLNRNAFDSDTTRSIDDNKSRKRKRKVSKKVIALGIAVDIVITGLVTSWIIKRPVNKTHVGFGTVGLGLFYGAQWSIYKRLTKDKNV